MRTGILLLFSVFIFLTTSCQSKQNKMDVSTVAQLDLQKYLGTWYEIARFDHKFERNLVGVTATYSLRDDGKIKVINQGYKNTLDGELSIAEGKAKITKDPGKLKVSFFWIFYADYFVLELDENYQWALIGSSTDKYLWILSRTPILSKEDKTNILNKAQKRGYNIDHLIWVDQKEK